VAPIFAFLLRFLRTEILSRILLPGDVPSPIHPPAGCPFHPRCPIAEARCRTEAPPLTENQRGHFTACHLAGTRPELQR